MIGLVRLLSIYDYWSTNPVHHYSPTADRIPRDRFFEIHRYLHFVDNSLLPRYDSPGYDKLGKIQPVIDYLNSRFLSLYHPHRDVSVDEAMIKLGGKKQYAAVYAKETHQNVASRYGLEEMLQMAIYLNWKYMYERRHKMEKKDWGDML